MQLRPPCSRLLRGGQRGQLGSRRLSSPDLAAGSRFPEARGGDGGTGSQWASGPSAHASGRKGWRGVGPPGQPGSLPASLPWSCVPAESPLAPGAGLPTSKGVQEPAVALTLRLT